MELYQANPLTDKTQGEKSWLCNELEMKNRAFQKDRLRRICCAEAERARHLRVDEVSTQEQESKFTVNQLMVQIQELQDKVNFLNDTKEFYDPETASSSR